MSLPKAHEEHLRSVGVIVNIRLPYLYKMLQRSIHIEPDTTPYFIRSEMSFILFRSIGISNDDRVFQKLRNAKHIRGPLAQNVSLRN